MENILDLKDEVVLAIDWKSSKIPYTIQRYKPSHKKIYDVSFSSNSPDVLYILTNDDEVFSFEVSTLTTTKMVIIGLQSTSSIWRLLCHYEAIYIAQCSGTVSKCIIGDNYSLRVTSTYYRSHHYIPSRVIPSKHTYIHYFSNSLVDIIDSDTMTLLSTVSLLQRANDITIDDKLHIATDNGVHIYTTDGACTGQSYLDGEWCQSVVCTGNGYSVVGMKYKVALVCVSNIIDAASIYYISTMTSMSYYRVTCNVVDNSLAIVDWDKDCLVLVPQEVYQPPFSLFSLCMSTILLHVDELPISLLSPRLRELAQQYI